MAASTDNALEQAKSGKDVIDTSKIDGVKDRFQYEGVIEHLGAAILNQETALKEKMDELQKNNNPSPAALAGLQYEINKWSLTFNMFSSMIKAIKDVSSGIVQKV